MNLLLYYTASYSEFYMRTETNWKSVHRRVDVFDENWWYVSIS